MKKKMVKASILMLLLVQMGSNGLSPALSAISEAFPDASAAMVQFIMTFPNLMILVVSLVSAKLSEIVSKKILSSVGSLLCALGGIMAVFWHDTIPVLYLWTGVTGVGIGLVIPMAYSLVADVVDESEQPSLMGKSNTAATIGAMIMTFVGGLLSGISWYYNFLVFLMSVPGLALSLIFIPDIKTPRINAVSNPGNKEKLGINVYLYGGFAFLFLMAFNMGPANLSMLIARKEIGTVADAGNAASLFLLGGALLGLAFGVIYRKLGDYVIPTGAALLCLGFLIISRSSSLPQVYLGCLLSGASISFIMPRVMLGVQQESPRPLVTMATALVMGIGNLGTFVAPALTVFAAFLFGSESVEGRFFLGCILGAVEAVLGTVLVSFLKQRRLTGR